MLAFSNRFHGHGAIKYVYRNGSAKRGPTMTVKSAANKRRTTPRIAVVVSKKVLKSAVGRNRIRRRLYELFRHELPHITEGCDIACIVTSAEARTMDQGSLGDELRNLLRDAGFYKE